MKILSGLILLLFICSCTKSGGHRRTEALFHDDSMRGKSIEEIHAKYKRHNFQWSDKYKNKIYVYTYTRSKYSWMAHYPIFANFAENVSENYEVVLLYDKKSKFIDKRNFYNKVRKRTRVSCNVYGASCKFRIEEGAVPPPQRKSKIMKILRPLWGGVKFVGRGFKWAFSSSPDKEKVAP